MRRSIVEKTYKDRLVAAWKERSRLRSEGVTKASKGICVLTGLHYLKRLLYLGLRWMSELLISGEGAYNLSQVLENSPYSPDQLSKKSLEQLVSIGKKTEAAQLKEASVIKDFTISRSAQLNQEQGLPKGFIELKTQQDLGAETEFMNNCVGAGGAHPSDW
jgi:hypothetical protein